MRSLKVLHNYKNVFFSIVILFSLVSCGGSSGSNSNFGSVISQSGKWEGNFIITYPTSTSPQKNVTLFITQSGTNLTGAWSSGNNSYGTLTGTVNGNTMSITTTNLVCSDSATISGTISNSTYTFTGIGSSLIDCGISSNYTIAGTLNQTLVWSSSAPSFPLTLPQGLNVGAFVDSNGGKYSWLVGKHLEAVGGAPLSGYTWTVTLGTSLPYPGMIIDPLTGLMRGVPPLGFSAGTYNFSVTVSDGSTSITGPVKLIVSTCNSYLNSTTDLPSLCYYPPTPPDSNNTGTVTIGTTALPTVGKAYGYSISTNSGTPPFKNWQVSSGALPPGLTLDQSRGVLFGVPLVGSSGQTYQFGISYSDSANNVSQNPRTHILTIL